MSVDQGQGASGGIVLAVPRSLELAIDFATLATAPTYATLFTLALTTLQASSYLSFDFTCTVRHVGAFAGNVAPTLRLRLNGTLLPGGTTVNTVRQRIMPLARVGRVVVTTATNPQTLDVEISKFAGPANTLIIQPVTLPDLAHAALILREEL